jgi:endonuclease-3
VVNVKPGRGLAKEPFDIDRAVKLLRVAVTPFASAAMFELKDRGFTTVFQQLVSCIISIRTRDEVSLPVSIRLLTEAPTPADMLKLSVSEIDRLIRESTFHETKARQIRTIAETAVGAFGGELPAEFEVLTGFAGVGPKCAGLALGVAAGKEHIPVDVHVHRVVNRWGYAAARTPEKMMEELEKKLPRKFWLEINRLLVPFGKHICTGLHPKCSTCPLLSMCQQVGVKDPR